MAVYVIDPTGGGDYLTHAAAVAAVPNGSELQFTAGVHEVVGTSHTKTGLIYRPVTDGQVWSLVRSTGSGPALLFYTGADIDGGSGGVTISGGTNGLEGNGTSRTITLRRARVTGNTAVGVYRPATGSTFHQCSFDNNGTLGLHVISSQVVAVTSSVFWLNQNDGMNGAGCSVARSGFYCNNAGGVGTAQVNLGTTGTATEVIAEGGGLIGIKGTASIRCSSSGNAGADYSVTTETASVTGPVGWADAVNGDFAITSSSPAWHAGQPSAVTVDYAGTTYDASAPSIGPLEYVPPVEADDPLASEIASLWERLDIVDLVRIALGTRGVDDLGQGVGWWPDSFTEDAARIGWRIDLLERGVDTAADAERIRSSLAKSLRWLVTDGHADSVDVVATRVGQALGIDIEIKRDDSAGGAVTLRYPDMWEAVRNGL